MPKNARLKRTAGNRGVGRWKHKAEELCRLNGAYYLLQGRRFRALTDQALKERWLKCFRREFYTDDRLRTELDDIGAELSLRRLSIAEFLLPPAKRDRVERPPETNAEHVVTRAD
jgi:hypothetical protein